MNLRFSIHPSVYVFAALFLSLFVGFSSTLWAIIGVGTFFAVIEAGSYWNGAFKEKQ